MLEKLSKEELGIKPITWFVSNENMTRVHHLRTELMEETGRNVKLWEVYHYIIESFFKERNKKSK